MILSDVSRGYKEEKGKINWVLRNIDLKVGRGEHLGILGGPEAGKTTLVNLLGGADEPTKGRILRKGSVSWPIGSQACIMSVLSGRQNIRFICDLYGRNYGEALDFIIGFSGMERQLDMPVRRYKGEMKTRLAASILFAMNFDYMLGDNGMFGGDATFRARCIELLRKRLDSKATTLIMATSNPLHVRQYCTRAGILADGHIQMFDDIEEAIDRFSASHEAQAA